MPAGTCTDGATQAPAPSHLIMGALPAEATLAHVPVSKYADHLPSYRQSQILARAGLDLHRAVLADRVGKAAFHLKPVVDRLADHLKRSGKLFIDETTAPVPDPGRAGRQRPDISGRRPAMTGPGAAKTRPVWSTSMLLSAQVKMPKPS